MKEQKFNIGSILQEEPIYQTLEKACKKNKLPANVIGLAPIHKAHFIAQLTFDLEKRALVIAQDEANATRLSADINTFYGEEIARPFVSREYTFREVEGISKEYEHGRIAALSALSFGKCRILVASGESASQFTIPEALLRKETVILHPGDEVHLESLVKTLVESGYSRYEQVTGIAEFAVRGGILDVFPPTSPRPIRVEFWGDEIDSISLFDLMTQRRIEGAEEVPLPPVTELIAEEEEAFAEALKSQYESLEDAQKERSKVHYLKDIERLEAGEKLPHLDRYLPLVYTDPVTVFDYFSSDDLLFFAEVGNIRENVVAHETLHNEDLKALFSEGILFRGLDRYYLSYSEILQKYQKIPTIFLDQFARQLDDVALKELLNVEALTLSPWGGEITRLTEDVEEYTRRGFGITVLAGTEKSAQNIAKELDGAGYSAFFGDALSIPKAGEIRVLPGSLSSGIEYPAAKQAVITHMKMLVGAQKKRKKKNKNAIRNVSDLQKGDYVVHTAHGIGIFDGIEQILTEGLKKDYIKIRYAGADVLFVPVTQLDLVSKYVGPRENSSMRLNRLNSGQWEKTRSRVKKAVEGMAKELIELYAKRMQVKGFAFSEDTEWQKEFEERFEYQETDDQLEAIAEIKKDMERPVPMDRLLCGDVGFGKTEVALRAAFKAVSDGKQVALLVPTTILAWQHYSTMIKRFDGYPIEIGLLSRFRTPKQREETVKKLATGQVDVVVGTHRLVQNDIRFKNLGLAIIDEEQRFGVTHKEKFKEFATDVDVLSLSATPIPRTMNMALSGIRDMSVLEDPPQDRVPVQTYVLEHNDTVLAEAIRRELNRDGQVYYLHNRVEDMEKVVLRLQKLLPEANIGFAHGKMAEEELSEIWRRLIEHEIDILVCTTIIETGVDVPNCNTLIIEDADRLGLAQLYQIRGRVGRSSRRAFAYLTFKRGKVMTEEAQKRLTAIKEFTNFGSGFQIAMRDLEIRGAGNILGESQHGHMEAVGYDMYLKLLSEAIAEEKGEPKAQITEECMIDVQVEAYIPENYIRGTAQRIDIYQRIAAIVDDDGASDVTDELIDRFGEPPKPVMGLIRVALLRGTAAQLGIKEISQTGGSMLNLYVTTLNMDEISRLISRMENRLLVNAGNKPYLGIRLKKGEGVLPALENLLENWQEVRLEIEKEKGETNGID